MTDVAVVPADQGESDEASQQPLGLNAAKARLASARRARQTYEPDWFLNLAYYQGDQWCAYSSGRGIYHPRVRSSVKLTDNRIQPIVRTEVARLAKARPDWDATPRGLDEQAVNNAATSARLLDWTWDTMHMATKRREALEWSRIAGAGFVKTCWDATVGESAVDVLLDADGMVIPAADGSGPATKQKHPDQLVEGVTTKQIGGGEVVHTVRSPFDMYPDPLATSLLDARWVIDESVRSPEYIKERYGKTVAADAPAQVGVVESRMHSFASSAAGGEKIGVRVYELWEKRSAGAPEGRRVVWCDGELLLDGPNEYESLPYTMFPGIPVPGRFWPDSIVTHLRPIQARLNKLESQIAENAGRFGNPAILIDQLSQVKYHGVPGEQIRHSAINQTQLPQYLQPPTMPGYIPELVSQMESALREISGQYEVAQGSVPAGVTAASAISLLQEQDATRLGPDVEAAELAIGEWGRQTLRLQARYYTTDRIIVIVGPDGVVDVDTFRATEGFEVPDVSVVAGSTFPRSLAAKQAAIRDMLNLLFQYGVPVDGAALAGILRDMQVGGLERVVQSYTADTAQLSREHVALLSGTPFDVRVVDNDSVHVAGHEDFAKSARFLALPDDVQAILITHIAQHKMSMQGKQAQQEQIAAAAAAAAQPAGAGLPAGTVPTAPSGDAAPATDSPIGAAPTM